jgi:hypothetical protein
MVITSYGLTVVIDTKSHVLVFVLSSLTIILQFPVEIAVILVLCYTGFRRRHPAGQRGVFPAVVALATCECSLLHELLLW